MQRTGRSRRGDRRLLARVDEGLTERRLKCRVFAVAEATDDVAAAQAAAAAAASRGCASRVRQERSLSSGPAPLGNLRKGARQAAWSWRWST